MELDVKTLERAFKTVDNQIKAHVDQFKYQAGSDEVVRFHVNELTNAWDYIKQLKEDFESRQNYDRSPGTALQEHKGDLWDLYDNLNDGEWIAITTNGDTRFDHKAIMGRGCAKEAAERFPGIPERLGALLETQGNRCYVFLKERIVTFPVKHHWQDKADLYLIAASCDDLKDVMSVYSMKTVYLPRPGVGNGRLEWSKVKVILERGFNFDRRIVVVSKPGEE